MFIGKVVYVVTGHTISDMNGRDIQLKPKVFKNRKRAIDYVRSQFLKNAKTDMSDIFWCGPGEYIGVMLDPNYRPVEAIMRIRESTIE